MTVRSAPPGYARTKQGWLYLICFDEPLGHAGHYLGWTSDLAARIKAHRNGGGSRLMAAVKRQEITWVVAGVCTGTMMDEYLLKQRGGLRRCCPRCGGKYGNGLRKSRWQEPPAEVAELARRAA